MSRLNLNCGLCGRVQAEGLLSRGAWGHLEVSEGRMLRACPTCRTQYHDWEERLRVTVSAETQFGTRYGGVYR
jgi:hypothetical protein